MGTKTTTNRKARSPATKHAAVSRKECSSKKMTGELTEQFHRGRSVLFATCNLLVQQLLIAKRDLRLAKVITRLSKFDALIIDDLGYVQQSREEMEVLFTLLAERYERGSVMLTSNLPFSKWEQIFKDAMTTAAAIDRLVHHSIILELNVPSYRLEKAKRNDRAANNTSSKEGQK